MLNKIAQVLELDREVYVVHHNVFGNVENNRSKIQNTGDAEADESVRNFLGGCDGQGENGHLNAVAFDDFPQLFHFVERLFNRFAAFARVLIEGSDDFKTFLFETAIGEKRETKITDANQDDRLETVCAEQIRDHFAQLFDIIAEAAGAELSEVSQVFAELSGFYAGCFRQGFTGDGANPVVVQSLKTTQIYGKPIDGFARNFWAGQLFQARPV